MAATVETALSILALSVMLATSNASGSAEKAVECTYPRNQEIFAALEPRSSTFDAVIEYLNKHGIEFSIYSKEEQKISMQQIRQIGYGQFQPVRVSLVSPNPNPDRFANVTEDELLIMIFDDQKILSSVSCKKIYTGP